ncbi:glycosyltransferase family 4 protein [Gelidibacter salicanalis]|uniref:Glycosyltransferase family 4 protein n=1 Tax=Gelidibacter salicanalis TaxID=291193 RepID=A0A934NEG9_9FLAO|nr:glycosyltransferase family 4 protein [Gelidibacter salicanalis]MBJ7882705.1 glycosyltransferase family 4 protein [Gelidibacter salicanalis]
MNKKRILVVGSTATSLINFRGDFIQSLTDNGYEVFTAAGYADEETLSKLTEDYGVTALTYRIQRTGVNPFMDLQTISDLKKIIAEHQIQLVFPYTVKPVIYSTIAANSLNVPVISLITGLGFTFTGLSAKARALQHLNEFLYKRTIRKNKTVVFQNADDRDLFFERNILRDKSKAKIVSGSGVNLERFKFKDNGQARNPVRFLLTARLIKEKGIGLYIEAAKTLKTKYPSAEFHVIGPAQMSPSAIKLEELISLNEQGILIWHGHQYNIVENLTKVDVFVLPSYYREGVPRSILEALSVGLPIITTDSPGCRETVIPNKNGFLIPPQSLKELVDAMEFFILNPERIEEMGNNSRAYAEERFDVHIINRNLLKIINNVFNQQEQESSALHLK